MQKCDKCSAKSSIYLAYGPMQLCKAHYKEFFEKRVRRTINRHKLVKPGEKIAIAVSGGKDSITTLRMLKKIFPKGTEFFGICIDEGIPGYREKALKVAEKHFGELGVGFEKIWMKKGLGTTISEIAKKTGNESACSYCGTLRRKLLNQAALKNNCTKIATGHNLDDEAQTALMNFCNNNLIQLQRNGAKIDFGIKSLVPRVKPLYETPEQEVLWHAKLQGWETYAKGKCPFSGTAKRNHYRKLLDELEQNQPGSKYSIIRAAQQLKQKKTNALKINYCKTCSAPTHSQHCKVCLQLKSIGVL